MRNEELEMKKIFLAFVIFFVLCSCSFAAENNEDIYVRKDLLESYMKNIDLKFDQVFEKLDTLIKEQALMREDIKNIEKRLTGLESRVAKLETKVDGIYVALSNRIDGVEKRFDVLFYLVIAFIGVIGIVFALPVVQRWWEEHGNSKQKYFTLEDVEKLIEAKMKGNLSNAV